MDSSLEGRRYWEASRRVRETFARHQLANVLHWASGGLEDVPDDELETFTYGLAESVRTVEPAWAPVAETLKHMPVATLRAQLRAALDKIRVIAHDVATNEATELLRLTVQIGIPSREEDRDGCPRWFLLGSLADALVWMALKLFSEVPRSLIRPCGITGCERIYVAGRNQKYCPTHQREAHRQTQRRAERAFRQRQRAQKKRRRR